MSSSQALERGLKENAEEAWSLICQPNSHVFIAGLEKIAPVFDKVVSKQAGCEAEWRRIKQDSSKTNAGWN